MNVTIYRHYPAVSGIMPFSFCCFILLHFFKKIIGSFFLRILKELFRSTSLDPIQYFSQEINFIFVVNNNCSFLN